MAIHDEPPTLPDDTSQDSAGDPRPPRLPAATIDDLLAGVDGDPIATAWLRAVLLGERVSSGSHN